MSVPVQTRNENVASFRMRLFTAMMIIVATLTALGLYLAQRKVTADAERNLQENFQAELSSLHKLEELRHAAFYRFLDSAGLVIKPPNPRDVGELDQKTEAQLNLRKLPKTQQIGYVQV